MPPWLVVGAAVAAVAAAVPLVRSAQQRDAYAPGAVVTAPPASAAASGTPTSARPSPSATHSLHVLPPTGTGSVATTPRCDGPALVVSVTGPDGAAGTTYHTVVLTNTGRSACHLEGYPGVAATGGAATLDARRDSGIPPSRVVLRPGQAAHAVLAVRNAPSSTAPCPTYRQLLVTPPDSRRTTAFPLQVRPCDGGGRRRPARCG